MKKAIYTATKILTCIFVQVHVHICRQLKYPLNHIEIPYIAHYWKVIQTVWHLMSGVWISVN